MTIDLVASAFRTSCCPIFRGSARVPMTLSCARLGVRRTHTGGDLDLYIVQNERTRRYSLVWSPVGRGRTFVYSADMTRCEAFALTDQAGPQKVCRGRWVSKTEVTSQIRAIFDRTNDRGIFSD